MTGCAPEITAIQNNFNHKLNFTNLKPYLINNQGGIIGFFEKIVILLPKP